MNHFQLRSFSAFTGWKRVFASFCVLTALFAFGGRMLATSAAAAVAAETKSEHVETAPVVVTPVEEEKESGLPNAAVPLFYGFGGHGPVLDAEGKVLEKAQYGPFAVTNSILVTWIVAALILVFAQYATRSIKQVPDGAQNFWEFLVESLRNFLEGIIGRHLAKKTFWFFATLFIFILFTNWFSLLPGVGTIGWGHINHDNEFILTKPLLRGANADLNMTLAMSMLFFGCWIVWGFQANGFGGFLMHLFGPKGNMPNPIMKALMAVVFFIVGWLEVVSILLRPVSLSFRLYGNIFAGENVLESMSHLVPALAPIIPIPFYFMELLVGIVQALVFMLLTAVFTLLICSHDEGPESDGSHHH